MFIARIWPLTRALLRPYLPYADPLRRCRARRQARALVACEPWPQEDATALDIAQLLLLRLLWLQRATRRALSGRQHDAAALLVRAAVETCIAGHYWLCDDSDVELMRAHNARSLRRLLSPFADGDPISPALIDGVAATIASSTAQPPPLSEMARIVARDSDHTLVTDLYERLYIPLSTVYAHPTGASLERHATRKLKLSERPAHGWTARSMCHAVDTCMAALALALAQRAGADQTKLVSYANAHMSRTAPPIVAISGRAILGGLRPTRLLSALRSMRGLLRYYDSGEAARDPEPLRKQRTEQFYSELLLAMGAKDEPYIRPLLDSFTQITTQLPDEQQAPPA